MIGEILYFLAWKEILVRYRHAFFGLFWALFRPLISAFVFSYLFGRSSPFLFVLSAYLPWQFFSMSVSEMTLSLLNHTNLITKVYFPRSFLPLSLMIVNGVDFLIGFSLVFGLSLFFFGPSFKLLAIPFLMLEMALLACGVGLFLSAMTVRFRDIRFLVPFFVQLTLFLSPVVYSGELISESLRGFYALNPLVGLIEGFRWALLGISLPCGLFGQILSCTTTFLLFLGGVFVFQREEKSFADAL